nr:substrate-binding domain-containing protein [Collinsella urealyticum]
MSNAGNVFVGSSIGRLEAELERVDYSALFIDFHGDVDVLMHKIRFLRSRLVEGIVIFSSEVDAQCLEALPQLDIPLIVVDNPMPHSEIDSIVVDNADSTKRVVSAMLDAGHQRIGVIAPSQTTYVGRERLVGWQRAYADRHAEAYKGDIQICDSTKLGGYRAACQLLDQGEVTALFACNYYMALGALKAVNERGLRPGSDIGFASFDDYDFSDVMFPPLTVIRQPMEEIVDLIIEMMRQRLQGDRNDFGTHMLTCDVVLTDSIHAQLAPQ